MKHNEEHYRGTTKKSRFAFGFGSFGTGLIYTMITAYLMFFLTQVAGLSGSIVGTFFLLAKFFDAVDDPLVGALVNNGKSRGVKYRTWIIFGAIISAILFAFMFLPVSFSLTGKYFYYFTLYILWSIAYTVVDIPYTSLVPNAAGSEDERYKMNSNAQIFSGIATIGVTVLVPIVISSIAKTPSGRSGYFLVAAVIALLSIVSLFVAGFGIKERDNSKVNETISFKGFFKAFIKNDQAISLFFPILFANTAFGLTLGLGTYFFAYDVGNFAKFSIYMLISGIGMAIAFLTYPFLAKKVGKKPLFVASSLMCIVGYALMFAANIVFHGNIVILSVASLPSILGLGYINVSRMTMISNVCDYSEIKIGKRFETIWVSIISFVNKASSAIVAFCIGIALDVAGISGLDPSTDSAVISAMGINVIRILMFIIPIVLVSLGLVTYLSFYKLDNPGYLDKIKRKQKINSKEN